MLVEVCCNSLESALNAEKAGADRIELCSELGVGGVTPSYGLLQLVKSRLSIPVHVLIRPRSAHFTYTDLEFEVMLNDIGLCISAGADGIVSGILNADATLDIQRTQKLIKKAAPLHFTFHRAFDWISDQKKALQQLDQLGAHCVLTSGGKANSHNALTQLAQLKKLNTHMVIMPGGGIHHQNVLDFKKEGFSAIHLSGSQFQHHLPQTDKIPLNSNRHLQEDRVAVTNAQVIAEVVQLVK